MDATRLNTLGGPWRKFRTVNCTDTSFPSKIPTATEPTGVGATAGGAAVIDLINTGSLERSASIQNGICLCFFGAGSDTQTFVAKGIGWSCVGDSPALDVAPDTTLWIPTTLFEVTCTLSTPTGLANKAVVATDLFVDTIVKVGTTYNEGVNVNTVSPADNTIAYLYADLSGHMKFELIFDMTGATNGNALFKLF